MKYTALGNSDLKVSRICLGCMGFGDAKNGQHSWTVDETHSREIIRRALELAYLKEPCVPHALAGVFPLVNRWYGPYRARSKMQQTD